MRFVFAIAVLSVAAVMQADDFVITTHAHTAAGLFVVTDRPQTPQQQPEAVTTGKEPNKAATGCYLLKFESASCGPCKIWDRTERPKVTSTLTVVDIGVHPEWTRYIHPTIPAVQSLPTFWAVDRVTRQPVKHWTGSGTTAKQLNDFVAAYVPVPAARNVQAQPISTIPRFDRVSEISHLLDPKTQHAGKFTRPQLNAMTDMQLIDLHNREHGTITVNGVRQSR